MMCRSGDGCLRRVLCNSNEVCVGLHSVLNVYTPVVGNIRSEYEFVGIDETHVQYVCCVKMGKVGGESYEAESAGVPLSSAGMSTTAR